MILISHTTPSLPVVSFIFFFFELKMLRATRLLFPKPFTAVHLTPVKPPTARWVHTAPSTEYNVQPVIRHFKRQKHMPYFLEYMMWVVFGSMALHLIWLKMDYKDYRERTAHKTKLLEDLVQRVENGEQIDEDLKQEIKMLLMNEQMYKANSQQEDISDEYLNSCKYIHMNLVLF